MTLRNLSSTLRQLSQIPNWTHHPNPSPRRVFLQRETRTITSSLQAAATIPKTRISLLLRRLAHTIPRPPTQSSTSTSPSSRSVSSPPHKPTYALTFTCLPCSTRSRHLVSKQAYHHGSCLVACPVCKNRHVISDHLGIFSSSSSSYKTIEDILREKGQLVKKGTLGVAGVFDNEEEEVGDLEFWEDGTITRREEREREEGILVGGGGSNAGKDET